MQTGSRYLILAISFSISGHSICGPCFVVSGLGHKATENSAHVFSGCMQGRGLGKKRGDIPFSFQGGVLSPKESTVGSEIHECAAFSFFRRVYFAAYGQDALLIFNALASPLHWCYTNRALFMIKIEKVDSFGIFFYYLRSRACPCMRLSWEFTVFGMAWILLFLFS